MRSSARFAEPTMPWPHCAYSDCILYSTSRGVKRSVTKPPDGSVRSYEAAKIQPAISRLLALSGRDGAQCHWQNPRGASQNGFSLACQGRWAATSQPIQAESLFLY